MSGLAAAELLALLACAQTSLTPEPPPTMVSPTRPGEQAQPDQVSPSEPSVAPVQLPAEPAIPAIGGGQQQTPGDPGAFEQIHTREDFGPPSPPDATSPGWEPVRGPHTSLMQLRRGLDDLEARRAAQRLVVDSMYRRRRDALKADENFRGLPRARRRELLRRLSDGRDAQLRAVDEAADRLRDAILTRIKEKTP